MLLKPAVTPEAALDWLKARVAESYGVEVTPQIEAKLRVTAEAMAEVSATDLGEEIEPLLL